MNANGSADNESGEPPAKRQKKKLAVEKHILSSSPGGANLTVDYSKEAKLEETGDSATNAKKVPFISADMLYRIKALSRSYNVARIRFE